MLQALITVALAAAQAAPAPNPYAPPGACTPCHPAIARTYAQTGMGRSFYTPTPANLHTNESQPYYHAPSNSYFTITQKDGRFNQRRHQLDPAGQPINIYEKSIDYILGSGNHAQTFLHRTPRGTLIELPLGWYAENGGTFAMNPGYDSPSHEGFRRKVSYDCMFCHNAYPAIPAGHDRSFAEPVYSTPLPTGIDCQRCHGPGRRHIQLAQSPATTREALRAAITNPARLSPERREEVCIQCHLETTSFPLPNALPRYGQGPFAYRPGLPLSDYWIFFDHAPSANRGDKFELVNAVYRIRQSKCYLANPAALGCTTCHNPHDVPRAEAATRHYDAACRSCHTAAFNELVSTGRHTAAPNCASCHMPKRRTEDVIHSLATDHLIQRRPPPGDLTAPLPERHETGSEAYRGPVSLYYPAALPNTPTNALYLSLAQVIDQSNLAAGIPQLTAALAAQPASAPPQSLAPFTLALAEAHRAAGSLSKALPLYRQAVAQSPRTVFYLQKLATALRASGQPAQALTAIQQAAALDPNNPATLHELGLVQHALNHPAPSIAAFQKAITLDPDLPEPHSNLGIVLVTTGDQTRAEAAFREAIRIQPSYADAHNNLANLLSASGDFPQARTHFETALRLKPTDARTHFNYAMALGRVRDFAAAQIQLEAALTADPALAEARIILAQLLLAKGDNAAAIEHLKKATAAPDPEVRKAAADLLRELGVR